MNNRKSLKISFFEGKTGNGSEHTTIYRLGTASPKQRKRGRKKEWIKIGADGVINANSANQKESAYTLFLGSIYLKVTKHTKPNGKYFYNACYLDINEASKETTEKKVDMQTLEPPLLI